jgi:hypothetical protein
LIAFIGYKSPDILFCLDHRGWLLDELEPADRLRRLPDEGADVVVVPREFADRLAAFEGLPTTIILDSPAFVAIRATARANITEN